MKSIAIVVGCIALMAPQTALAANSVCDAYNPQTCIVASAGATRGSGRHSAAGESVLRGALPFTGLDVILIVLAGATLVGVGLLISRLSRSSLN